jgi:hypothetical protein
LNKAVIENAACGITTGSEALVKEKRYAGGIILAENSTFRNNTMAIKLLKFNYKPTDLNAAYHIKKCTFETDAPSFEEKVASFIDITGVCGSDIGDNAFKNTSKQD